MKSIKPKVKQEQIIALLQKYFHNPISNIVTKQNDLVAQSLSFRSGDKDFTLSFTTEKMDVSYKKISFVYNNFASVNIPIPKVIAYGHIEDSYYIIAEKETGKILNTLPDSESNLLLPELINTLYYIHQTDVSKWKNYGWINDSGEGLFPSWKNFISNVNKEERENAFYGKWHQMFDNTFLDRIFFDKVYNYMLELLNYCSEDRFLVHSGYGYDNVLIKTGKVSAVLGWFDAMYGDFVYDISWLDFWPRGINFTNLIYNYYIEKGMNIINFKERVNCYKCYIGLDAMRFFAKTDNLKAYKYTCELLNKIILM